MVLVLLRQVEIPGVEPVGYWPRWCFLWGLIAFDLALFQAMPPLPGRRRWTARLAGAGAWAALVAAGIGTVGYQRPLARFKEVVPDRIFISAMPTYRGLDVAYRRHPFKTIINLFPEELPGLRSPRLAEEERFARERGIHYVRSPLGALKADAFLDRTLELARDPEAWPILVHCHGCMDRTPAWTGIYRFLIEGKPLADAIREIERHRGYRPKASVTLLYNRVLAERDPARWAADPTARVLEECAAETPDPFYEQLRLERAALANPNGVPRVSRRDDGKVGDRIHRP